MKHLSTLFLLVLTTVFPVFAGPEVRSGFDRVAGVYSWKSGDQFRRIKILQHGTVFYTAGTVAGSREQIERRRTLKIKYSNTIDIEKERFWFCSLEDDTGQIVGSVLFPDSYDIWDIKKCYFLKDEGKALARYQREPPESL